MAGKPDYDDALGCRHSGLPLGGIGAGSLELRPDGRFHRWYLMNNRPWGAAPETECMEGCGLRFGLVCEDQGRRRALALESHSGLDPKLDGWFWFSDPYHLPWVGHAEAIEYQARIPFARLRYRFSEAPLDARLTAWSPFIPGSAADSNTPGAVLSFRLTNRTRRPLRVTLFGLLKNAAGYDHPELASEMRFEPARGDSPAGLRMTRGGLDARALTQGTLALFAHASAPARATFALHPRHGRDLWDPLLATGRLEDMDYSRQGGTMGEIGAERKVSGPLGLTRGALGLNFALAARREVEVTFYLAWHFPNFRELDRKDRAGECIGVQYANRFADAVEVGRRLHRERARLEAGTRAFAEAFGDSSLPAWELDAVSASLAVLYRAAWWDRAGRFGIWEGLGCCGLQTIDVGHYGSFPVLQMFPELDASQNALSAANREPDGKAPHTMPGQFGRSDYSGKRGRIDLCPQFVLAVWRHALWTGGLAEARALWPMVLGNMEWISAADSDGDGLPNNLGPDQTYDRFPMQGTSAFVGILYLAALKAAAELAEWLGEADQAAAWRRRFEAARPVLESQLWNGRCYNLSYLAEKKKADYGCMSDQLNGDWFYRQCRGEGLLRDARVRRALRAILRRNRRTSGPHAWLANATWPRGKGVEIVRTGSDQVSCPWSGVEYAVAAELAWLGLRREARRTARDVFARYEAAGMRFNHVECGEFYHRCMSAWALYQAEFGIAYDGIRRRLQVAPPRGDARFLIIVPGGSAAAEWKERTRRLRLRMLSGRLALRELCVNGREMEAQAAVLAAGLCALRLRRKKE